MIVAESQDIGKIEAVLKDPRIYDTISADGDPIPSDFTLPMEGHRYILGEDSGPFAVFIIHPYKDGDKIHIQVLPECRDKAVEFASKSLKLTTRKLYADIPECYPNVIAFAESFGFESVGMKDTGYIKRGNHYLISCLERDEWAS